MLNLAYVLFTSNDKEQEQLKIPYPIETLLQIPYFKSYIHFDNHKGDTGPPCTEKIFKLNGNPETLDKIIYIYNTDWPKIASQKNNDDFNNYYRLADYLGISNEELGEKFLESTIYQLPKHLINRENVDLIPTMLLNFKAKNFGKEVCVVYALDIDTTLITDKIHSYILEIGSWCFIKEYGSIFQKWILNSDNREIDWLFEYTKINILNDFITSNSKKFNVKTNIIGFYFFYLIGYNYISKIKKEDLIKNIIQCWIIEKPSLGGDSELETWLMICCYVGFRLIEAKSNLGFYRAFDKPLVIENDSGNQWIDEEGGHQNLLDIQDIEYICDNFNNM